MPQRAPQAHHEEGHCKDKECRWPLRALCGEGVGEEAGLTDLTVFPIEVPGDPKRHQQLSKQRLILSADRGSGSTGEESTAPKEARLPHCGGSAETSSIGGG